MKLKRILFLTLLVSSLFTSISCSSQNKQKNDNTINKNKTTMGTIALTKDEFLKKVANYEKNPDEWKYLGDKPAIIDFYATWCGPCKSIAPSLEELAEEFKDQIYIYKIDTDKEQELAAAFGIRSIPTLLFIPMDGAPQMAQGAIPKKDLKKAIETVLLNKAEATK
ncbi:thioredoxin [Coprobacter tertius]|uniref:Thioredoxin n=1 Tax=Coprobacter tertius TaxID=2944915 RepID=A0ABT1MJS7_9BACT|nr:thioredoxin [Coprobacter tertius]MCP9612873.1 thioredoxin [Coprobacter tertius]